MVGPEGREPGSSSLRRNAYFTGIYPVAKDCRLSESSTAVAIVYSPPRTEAAHGESETWYLLVPTRRLVELVDTITLGQSAN